MEKSFPEFYDYYLSVIKERSYLNGQNMQVSFLIGLILFHNDREFDMYLYCTSSYSDTCIWISRKLELQACQHEQSMSIQSIVCDLRFVNLQSVTSCMDRNVSTCLRQLRKLP
jgi:hypothetical protein